MKRKQSKRDHLRNVLRNYLKHHAIQQNQLHEMVGMAGKYLLPKVEWNFNADIDAPTRLGVSLVHHPTVRAVFSGFISINELQMTSKTPLTDILREMAYQGRALRPDANRTLRKKRFTRYRKDMRHIIQHLADDGSLNRGAEKAITYSLLCIRKRFLM